VKLAVTLAVVAVFLFSTLVAAQDKTQAAEAAASSWLNLVDSGHYAESWKDASSLFKAAVSEDQWEQQLRGVRTPLGALISRRLQSAQYTTHLPGAPDGEYLVIQYDTSFADKKSAVETVTPMLDKDGRWRVSGYFIR
jgi:hypothetical protein